MSSAQLDIDPNEELALRSAAPLARLDVAQPDLSPAARKHQVAERLAAHRARRGQASHDTGLLDTASKDTAPEIAQPAETLRPAHGRSAHIAAAVAERYAHSQSYRAFLASEAERAVHQAQAVAQIATINAQAIAEAQQQLLTDLESWETPGTMPTGPVAVPNVPLSAIDYAELFGDACSASRTAAKEPVYPDLARAEWASSTQPVARTAEFTVRPYEDAVHPATAPRSSVSAEARRHSAPPERELDEDERFALDEEIAFRHSPVFDEVFEGEAIAANLIEFPRQLIAARKARPRLAEGPLRVDGASSDNGSQLRIFEVEAAQVSPAPVADALSPEWSSILLSALPAREFTDTADDGYLSESLPQAAPIRSRLLSAAVDACLIVAVQVAFTAVFVVAMRHLPGGGALLETPRATALAGTAASLVVFSLLYQLLFFTLSDATPGMRFARIGLCTFADESPTRSGMRRRIFATLLAALPLGLGLLWAFLDEDSLGWHDRITRMYQRSY